MSRLYKKIVLHLELFYVLSDTLYTNGNNFLRGRRRPPKIKVLYSMKGLHFLRKALTVGGYLKFVLKILRAPLTGSCHAFNTYFSNAKFAIRLSTYGMRTTVRTDLAIYIENMSASLGLYWFLSINRDHAGHLEVIKSIFLSEYFSLGLAHSYEIVWGSAWDGLALNTFEFIVWSSGHT